MKVYKIAQNFDHDNSQLILNASKYVFNIVKKAFDMHPVDAATFRKFIFNVAAEMGVLEFGSKIKFPENLGLDPAFEIMIYSSSNSGSKAEVHWNTMRIYTDSILRNSQTEMQNLYGTLVHEFAHVFNGGGTSPDEKIEDDGERAIKYLTDAGEIDSHAWEIAQVYVQMFPGQSFNNLKIDELAQKYINNTNFKAYLIKFKEPEIQKKYAKFADLGGLYTMVISKIQKYIDYITKYNEKEF